MENERKKGVISDDIERVIIFLSYSTNYNEIFFLSSRDLPFLRLANTEI